MKRRLALVTAAVLLAGCATQQAKYDWGQHDQKLYAYYKAPANLLEFSDALSAIVKAAETKHTRVPPGVYAEYGYLQLQAGKTKEAADLFGLEAAHWPESKVFMDRMSAVALGGSSSAPTK